MANSDTETWRIERQRPDGRELSGSERRRLNNRARTDGGRGRSAEKPSDIPARGWKDILWRVYAGVSDDRILANSAAATFYALLALFPAIAALVSIDGFFADPASIQQHLDCAPAVLQVGAVDALP